MKTVWVADVETESADHYIWLYAKEPTREAVIERLWQAEQAEDLDWYMETTSVFITEEEITQ